jgi:CRISPR system Cascade subunit CasD
LGARQWGGIIMPEFLILKLQAPMQAWGEHTFEGLRPSANFPTRSGVLGLLGACLGIRRNEPERLVELADSVGMAVRVDERRITRWDGTSRALQMMKITDYHTIQNARVYYSGLRSHETIQTWREYLFDAEFTVALWSHPNAPLSLTQLVEAVGRPVFTPYLGRRSCPIAQPLLHTLLEAADVIEAFKRMIPCGGTIYSEEKIEGQEVRMKRVRDVPLVHQPRQFAGRNIYIYGGEYVPE